MNYLLKTLLLLGMTQLTPVSYMLPASTQNRVCMDTLSPPITGRTLLGFKGIVESVSETYFKVSSDGIGMDTLKQPNSTHLYEFLPNGNLLTRSSKKHEAMDSNFNTSTALEYYENGTVKTRLLDMPSIGQVKFHCYWRDSIEYCQSDTLLNEANQIIRVYNHAGLLVHGIKHTAFLGKKPQSSEIVYTYDVNGHPKSQTGDDYQVNWTILKTDAQNNWTLAQTTRLFVNKKTKKRSKTTRWIVRSIRYYGA
jgi:hypothetical protein